MPIYVRGYARVFASTRHIPHSSSVVFKGLLASKERLDPYFIWLPG